MASRREKILAACAALSVALAFGYGLAVGKWHAFPHDALRAIYRRTRGLPADPREEARRAVEERVRVMAGSVEPSTLMRLHSSMDVDRMRRDLATSLWGPGGLPLSAPPARIEPGHRDLQWDSIPSLRSTVRLVVEMPPGIRSNILLFNAEKGRRFLLYHEGHGGRLGEGAPVLDRFLREGWAVVYLDMPLIGANPPADIVDPVQGPLRIMIHPQLAVLDHPLHYFLEPVCVALNHLRDAYGVEEADMIGFSGGGWTATVYAAIDPRIRRSFPVAGSIPLHMRTPGGWGHFEGFHPDLLRVANYLELYVLGSTGPGRGQVQVLNRYESSDRSGTNARAYEPHVRAAVNSLGAGTFEVFIDETQHSHAIAPTTLEEIVARLKAP